MKKTRYTEEQIVFELKQAETGTRVGKSAERWATTLTLRHRYLHKVVKIWHKWLA